MSSPELTLKEVEAYLKDHPKDANAWNTHGVLLATMKQFGPALRSLDHAIKLDASLHQAHTNRGRVLLSLGIDKAPESLKSFDTALKLKPNDIDALRDKAVALRALNRGPEEMKCLQAIVDTAPEEVHAWVRIGDIHLEEGQFSKADSAYTKVLEIDSQNVRAYIHQAIALSMQEKWTNAVKSAETACKLSPDNIEAWRVLGDVNLRAGKNRSAMKALKKASSIDPTDAQVENTMGMLQYTIGNLKDATRHFKRAIIRDKKNRRAYRNLALVSMELKDWLEAVGAWEKFIRFEKRDPDAYDALATSLARVDDFCGAAEAWEKARKTFKQKDKAKDASRVTELGRAAKINCSRMKKALREQKELERATRRRR
ncbi:MAG: tetratricopeptide repeat protein [Candidatus Thorarchaeota archaeon]|nr:tetratricopeptide repeat protein [Candidatus Thorarchaeota archaeon]